MNSERARSLTLRPHRACIPLVQKVVDLADVELITNKGSCNWAAHQLLKLAGFPITCGERDSFGWLSGVIHTNKGMIVYG